MRTTTTSLPRRARALAVAAAVGGVAAIALGAMPAGAAIGPSGPPVVMTPTAPRPCVVTIEGCRVTTSFPFAHNGDSVYAGSTFPQGSTGTVRYTMACPDGYTKTALVTIAGTRTSAKLSNYGERTGLQTCTMTQSVAPKYNTVAYLAPPDSDELWSSKHIEFFNVPTY